MTQAALLVRVLRHAELHDDLALNDSEQAQFAADLRLLVDEIERLRSDETRLEWMSGPPPSVGWWNASTHGWCDAYRWWDGNWWSEAAIPSDTAERAAELARSLEYGTTWIKWRHWA